MIFTYIKVQKYLVPAMATCQLPVKGHHFLLVLLLFWSHSCPCHVLASSQSIPHTKPVIFKKYKSDHMLLLVKVP